MANFYQRYQETISFFDRKHPHCLNGFMWGALVNRHWLACLWGLAKAWWVLVWHRQQMKYDLQQAGLSCWAFVESGSWGPFQSLLINEVIWLDWDYTYNNELKSNKKKSLNKYATGSEDQIRPTSDPHCISYFCMHFRWMILQGRISFSKNWHLLTLCYQVLYRRLWSHMPRWLVSLLCCTKFFCSSGFLTSYPSLFRAVFSPMEWYFSSILQDASE